MIDDPESIINYRNYLVNAPTKTLKLLANRNRISVSYSKNEIIANLLRKARYEASGSRTPIQQPTETVPSPPNNSAESNHNFRQILQRASEVRNRSNGERVMPIDISIILDEEFIELPPLPLEMPVINNVRHDIRQNHNNNTKKSMIIFYCLTDETKNTDCPICFECLDFTNQMTTNCNHTFCCSCMKEIIKRKTPIIDKDTYQIIECNDVKCPLCRTTITECHTLDNTEFVKGF